MKNPFLTSLLAAGMFAVGCYAADSGTVLTPECPALPAVCEIQTPEKLKNGACKPVCATLAEIAPELAGRTGFCRISGEYEGGLGFLGFKTEKQLFPDGPIRHFPANAQNTWTAFSFVMPMPAAAPTLRLTLFAEARSNLKIRNLKVESVPASAYVSPLETPDVRALNKMRHRQSRAAFAKHASAIIAFGDSLTDNWHGKRWTPIAQDFDILNAGICGDRVEELAARIADFDLENHPPEIVFLLIGTNNIKVGVTPLDIERGIAKVVGDLRRRSPGTTIVLIGLTPRGSYEKVAIPSTAAVNRRLAARYTIDPQVIYADLSDSFANPDGSLKQEFYERDNLHFSDRGYAEIVDPFYRRKIHEIRMIPPAARALFQYWTVYLTDRMNAAADSSSVEAHLCAKSHLAAARKMYGKMSDTACSGTKVKPVIPGEILRQEKEEGLPPELQKLLDAFRAACPEFTIE